MPMWLKAGGDLVGSEIAQNCAFKQRTLEDVSVCCALGPQSPAVPRGGREAPGVTTTHLRQRGSPRRCHRTPAKAVQWQRPPLKREQDCGRVLAIQLTSCRGAGG
eukprot:12022728-Heterocapsa_arctica.AAC.1